MRSLVEQAIDEFGSVDLLCGKSSIGEMPGLRTHIGPPFRNDSAKSRILSWSAFSRWVRTQSTTFPKGTPLLLTSNPPFWPQIARSWKQRVKGPVTLLLWDTYPEAIERFVGVRRSSPISRAWRRMNRRGLNVADQVLTISEDMRNLWLQYGQREIAIVPTWVETDRIHPIAPDQNQIRADRGWGERTVVLYSGNLGTVHDVSILPEAAHRLRNCSNIQFAIAGSGAAKSGLEKRTAELDLPNLEFLPFLPEDEFALLIAAADIAVVSLAEGAEGISMPSKTYSNMAAGCALLTINKLGGDLDRVVQEYQCGVNVRPGDADAAAQAIRQMAEEPDLLAKYQAQARAAAVEHFDVRVVIPRILDLIAKGAP